MFCSAKIVKIGHICNLLGKKSGKSCFYSAFSMGLALPVFAFGCPMFFYFIPCGMKYSTFCLDGQIFAEKKERILFSSLKSVSGQWAVAF